MTGTWVNVGGILIGSLLGLLLKKGIPRRIGDAIIQVEGLALGIIALNGVIAAMFTVDPVTGVLSDAGGLLLLVCMVLGCLVGELLRIDDRLNNFGKWVEGRLRSEGFAQGFVTATLLFTVGAMTIVGALNDGLTGDSSVLFIKAMLDFTTAIVLTSSLGIGVLFAAVPVLVIQGTISLLASQIAPFISDELLSMVCMVGYAIVLVMGVNFLCGTKVKTANLLPSLVFPVAYYFLFLT